MMLNFHSKTLTKLIIETLVCVNFLILNIQNISYLRILLTMAKKRFIKINKYINSKYYSYVYTKYI